MTERTLPVEIVVLDAMGVLYQAGDDVAELLVPFVTERGGADAPTVLGAYLRASRGELTAAAFWASVGLDREEEDAYLARHRVAPDLVEFLDGAVGAGYALACLSNDISEWSLALRRRFGLERWISTWVISGDVKVRKPEPGIYAALLQRLDRPAASILLVDDRRPNLDAAARAGLQTVLLGASSGAGSHRCVPSLRALGALLRADGARAHPLGSPLTRG